jgi:hypothetical protein
VSPEALPQEALAPRAKRPRRWLRRIAYFLGTLVLLALLAAFAMFLRLKRRGRPSQAIAPVVGDSERAIELRQLVRLGLSVPDGGVILERPFEPPWTSRSLIVPQHWYPPGALATMANYDLKVHASDLLADLDVLQPVMERAYGGWDSALRRGWSWDAWFTDWRTALKQSGERELSLDEAFAPFDTLISFQRDNHTQIPLQRFATLSASETYLLTRPAVAPCTQLVASSGKTLPLVPTDPGQRVRDALTLSPDGSALVPARYVVRPVVDGPLETIVCGSDSIPLAASERNRHTFAQMMWNELTAGGAGSPEVRRISEETVYARVPSMNPVVYRDLEARAALWPKPTGREKLLIVDLRDNDGGDDHFGFAVLRGWVDEMRVVGPDKLGMQVASSCLYAPLKWGFTRFFEQGMQPPLPADDRRSLQEALDALSAPAKTGCPREVTETRAQWTYRDHHLERGVPGMRIVVWINAGCGSDCELLTERLASLPESVVVGANTLGLAQFTQPGYGMLPHVRLPFRLALGTSDSYGDQRSFDGYGLDVDVVLSQRDWSVERIETIARLLR